VASVFDQKTVISRAVAQVSTDYQVPPLGSNFSLGQIKTTTALSECTGVDCKLIHGDRYQYVTGTQTTYIGTDCDETINRNWTLQVNGTTSLTFIGAYNAVYNSSVTTHEIGSSYNSESDSLFAWSPTQMEAIGFVFEIVPLDITIAGLDLTVCVVADITFATVDVAFGIVVEEFKVVHTREAAEKAELAAMKTNIGMLADNIYAMLAAGCPSINAAPEIASAQIPPF
jgi:hypothetical protein